MYNFSKVSALVWTLVKENAMNILPRDISLTFIRSQFVVETYSTIAQRAQDNKFVDSGLKNWVLVNSGNNYHKFREDLN